MIIISHRGNIKGSVPDKENRPSYIDCAIQLGYDVEVDVRYLNGQFWLGHDFPDYRVDTKWLECRRTKLWLHCKNREAAVALKAQEHIYNYFCHSVEEFTLVSTNHLWVHDVNGYVDSSCIIPLLTENDISAFNNKLPFAVCTDYVKICTEKFKAL